MTQSINTGVSAMRSFLYNDKSILPNHKYMNFKFKLGLSLSLILLQFPKCNSQIFQFLKKADHIEISGGPSLATLRMNDKIEQMKLVPKIGYAAKLDFDFYINKLISVNTTFFYERKGYKRKSVGYYYDPTKDSTNCKCTTSLGQSEVNSSRDYLEFSLAPKFKIARNFYVKSGIYFGYLLAIITVEKYSWTNSNQYRGISPDLRRIDAGVTISLNYNIKIGDTNTIAISLNEVYGLMDIAKSTSSGNRTNSISLQIGYILKSK